MKRYVLTLVIVLLISSAAAKSVNFSAGETKTLEIGDETEELELLWVNQNSDTPQIYYANFETADNATLSISSWNAHNFTSPNGYQYVQDYINGEYVALMEWEGVETDEVSDDEARIAWGRDYFPCESYTPESNEVKFCEDDIPKNVEIGDNGLNITLYFTSVTRQSPDEPEGMFHIEVENDFDAGSVSLEPPTGEGYWDIPGYRLFASQTRGARTSSNIDDAAVLKYMDMIDSINAVSVDKDGLTAEISSEAQAGNEANQKLGFTIDSYEWDLDGDGTYEESGQTVQKTYGSPGNKTIGLRVGSSDIQGQSGFFETTQLEVSVQESGGGDDGDNRTVSSKDNFSYGEFAVVREGDTVSFEGQNYTIAYVTPLSLGIELDSNTNTGTPHYYESNEIPFGSGNYVYSCEPQGPYSYQDEATARFTVLEDGQKNPLEVCGVDVDEKRSQDHSGYDMTDYDLGNPVNLSEGEGLLFGQNSAAYLEKITVFDAGSNLIQGEGYVEWSRKNPDYGSMHRLIAPNPGYSTTEWFKEGKMAIGTCSASADEMRIVMEKTSVINSNSGTWPDDWCQGTGGGDGGGDTYQVRNTDITDYIGGAVKNVKPMTELRFGDSQQNSLYVKNMTEASYYFGKINGYAGSPGSDSFQVNNSNAVKGVKKSFQSGDYWIHLCSSGVNETGAWLSIAKESGTNGYEACFDQQVDDPANYQSVDYTVGDKVEVSPGDKLVFGQNDQNQLFIKGFDDLGSYDKKQLDAYAHELVDRGRVAPVEGTRTSKYFYTGEHWTYFCSYDESSNTGEIVIRENENTDNQEVCQDQNVAQPDGTVSIGSSTYPVGAQVEVDVGIATQGTYRVEVNLEGNSLTSSNVDSQTSITVTPSSNGTLTAELIAPGTWWNPFNNDKLIHTDQAEIVSQSNQSQQDCQEMIENAKQQGQNQMCTDQSMTLQCPIASVTYTASNGCEIDYLKQQGWTAVGGPITGGNQSSNGTADVDLDKAQYVQGEEVEISAFNSKDHEIVVEDPDGQEVQTYQVSGTAQSFSFQTQNRQLGDYTVKLFPQAQNPFSIGNLVGSLIGGPVDSETFELKNNVSGWESYCQTRGFDSSLQGKIDCIKQDIVPNCFTPNPGAQCTQISQSLCQEILGYQFSTNQGRCIEP